MEPGTTRLDKLSDEIRRIWWAFGPADNRGAKVLELTERAKKLEEEHAELRAMLEVFADGETIIKPRHVGAAADLLRRIEGPTHPGAKCR